MAVRSSSFMSRGDLGSAPTGPEQLLQWLLFLRVVVATFVLGRIFVLEIVQARQAFFILITTHVLTALLSALFVRRWAERNWFILAQVYWDVLFISGLVFLSGGVDSFFPFMYVLAVINASILLNRRETTLAGVVCSILMTGIFLAHWSGKVALPNVLPGAPPVTLRDIVLKLIFHVFAIFAAAYLAGFLSERSRSVSEELGRKQEDLERLRARFEHMIRSIPIGLLALDEQDTVIFANAAAHSILGVANLESDTRRLGDLLPTPTSRSERRPHHVTLTRGETTLYLEVGYSPLLAEDGSVMGALVTIEDRSAVKTMEDEVRRTDRLAAVGKLAAGIAHEIRNPLASMSGSIQLLSKELSLDAVNAHLMNIVIRETERLNTLVTEFLSFARPGPGKEEFIDARLVVAETVKMLENEPACRNGIRVVTEFPIPLFLRADANQLRQVFWNLSINAVQAMPSGGELRLKGALRQRPIEGFDGDVVEIQFRDQGVGMDEKTLKSIFDPFFTTKESGTGLGLTTCHSIVEMFRGRIMVDSAPGHGTTFTLRFPAA